MTSRLSDPRLSNLLRLAVVVGTVSGIVGLVSIVVLRGWSETNQYVSVFVSLPLVAFMAWIGASSNPRNRLVWVLVAWQLGVGSHPFFVALRSIVEPDLPLLIDVDTIERSELSIATAVIEGTSTAFSSFGMLALLTFGLLLFPDGRLPSPRWWWLARLFAVCLSAVTLLNFLDFLPVADDLAPIGGLMVVFNVFVLGGPPLSVVSLFVRYRTRDRETRSRIRWLLWGAALALPAVVVGIYSNLTAAFGVAFLFLFIAYGMAILRHNLFDVDVVISRTLVYGLLAGLIATVYIGVVVGVGSLVGSGDEPNPVLAIAATALVAVAFQPARLRLQRLANRLVFGRRSTPYEVLSDFSRRVAATSDSLLLDAARSLVEGTAAERVVVTIDLGNETTEAAAWPIADADPAHSTDVLRLPIVEGGVQLGSLDVFTAPGNALPDDDRRLAEHLAAGMGLALTNQALTERLASRIDELRGSRRRLVAVQDDTRRRLERDLHDGAQQQLVALKVKLGLCRSLVDVSRHAELAAKLDRLSHDADRSVEALRDFARGVYPPLLESEGLEAAIGAQARRSGRPVEVDADGIGRYPREVESSVYFCVLEALEAVGDDAAPTRARIQLSQNNGSLRFEVHNDGGIDDRLGSQAVAQPALRRIGDRLDALSGSFDISGDPDRGITLSGVVPVEVVPS